MILTFYFFLIISLGTTAQVTLDPTHHCQGDTPEPTSRFHMLLFISSIHLCFASD